MLGSRPAAASTARCSALGGKTTLDSVLAIPENLWVGSAHSKWPFVGCLLS
jgi:hypothetical protein